MTFVKLSTIEDTYRLIPEGMYEATVTNVDCQPGDVDLNKNPDGNHKWIVEFSLEPPDGKGVVKVSKTFLWYGKAKVFAWRGAQAILGRPIPLDDDFDDEETDEYLHRTVKVVVGHYTRNDGSEGNQIETILKAAEDPTAPTPRGGKKLNF